MSSAGVLAKAPGRGGPPAWDVERIRRDFPILAVSANGRPLVYLDNAATSQTPQAVIDAEANYYREINSNIHRGIHFLSGKATDAYEGAREKVRRFINAAETSEIIFVRGTTEAVNLVAATFGRARLGAGDEVLISGMEHHSNIVPWQLACQASGASLKVIPVSDDGELILDDLDRLIGPRTKIVAVVHVSNALGTINPVRRIVEAAHARGVPVLLDGAQAVPHMKVDVRDLGCDFYAFSGHKMYGPMGAGVLYGRREILETLPPYQGGGDMISSVTFEKTVYNKLPHRFEAGTPNVAGVVALGAAVDYLESVKMDLAAAHEADLLAYATARLDEIPQVRIIGRAREKSSVISFVLDEIHPHDIGTILDQEGIAIRAGHHCTQPLMERFCVAATARASFGIYNTRGEADALAAGVRKVLEVFG
ncbi:MAG TPA: cysteine desulfurase [Candidatus Saccharimonadales bacterium]|nr:cysteine desulfurase [Candidatus Saccharimonadales bacterium]